MAALELLRELESALLAEFGARRMYARLSSLDRDRELGALLGRFALETDEQIARVNGLLVALGGCARRGSFRRRTLAEVLAWTTRLGLRRVVLGILLQAEDQRARGYAQFQQLLLGAGRVGEARECARLATTARRHASALGAWVPT
jgi:hypothetical protein